jgi:hypothetical protein
MLGIRTSGQFPVPREKARLGDPLPGGLSLQDYPVTFSDQFLNRNLEAVTK